MINVIEQSASSFCTLNGRVFDPDSPGSTIAQHSVMLFADVKDEARHQVDGGGIQTKPSIISGKNDCLHFNATGEIRKALLSSSKIEILRTPPHQDFDGPPSSWNDFVRATVRITLPSGEVFTRTDASAVVFGSQLLFAPIFRKREYYGSSSWDICQEWQVTGVERASSGRWWRIFYKLHYKSTYAGKPREDYVVAYSQSVEMSNRRVLPPEPATGTLEYVKELYTNQYGAISHTKERLDYDSHEVYDFGDLSLDAANNVRLCDINTIAYLKDFVEIKSLAESLASVVGPLRNAKAALKVAAGAYLAIHYGVKLTIADTEELAEGIERFDFDHQYQTIGSQKGYQLPLPGQPDVSVNVSYRLMGKINSFSLEQLYFLDKLKHAKRAMYEYDLVPSIANLWDMLPWSFVVDWFVPIGQQAERLEQKHYMQTLPVHFLSYSRIYEWDVALRDKTDLGNYYLGNVHYKIYERIITDQFENPPFRAERPKGNLTHVVEATALLISNFF